MKIYSVFGSVGAHEKEFMLIKFNLESEGVHEWVAVESDHRFRGNTKEHHLQKVIDSDDRFKPFRDRIKIISLKGPTTFERQFNAGRDRVFETAEDEDWILISDTDESLDFSDPKRRDIIMKRFNEYDEPLGLFTKRFWYDINNTYDYPMWQPCKKVKHIKAGISFADRFSKLRNIPEAEPLGFEYSSCFENRELIWYKRSELTFWHCGTLREEIDIALDCNHWYRMSRQKNPREGLDQPYHWFYNIELAPDNSPQYVRDNYDYLFKQNVDPNYEENRIIAYGAGYKDREIFYSAEQTKAALERIHVGGNK